MLVGNVHRNSAQSVGRMCTDPIEKVFQFFISLLPAVLAHWNEERRPVTYRTVRSTRVGVCVFAVCYGCSNSTYPGAWGTVWMRVSELILVESTWKIGVFRLIYLERFTFQLGILRFWLGIGATRVTCAHWRFPGARVQMKSQQFPILTWR
jgi:hypothetical protein